MVPTKDQTCQEMAATYFCLGRKQDPIRLHRKYENFIFSLENSLG